MVNAFRYVFDGNLYTAFSEPAGLENGRKVFIITCPDFKDKVFEFVETGVNEARYQPKEANCLTPFSQMLLQWFSDFKLHSN